MNILGLQLWTQKLDEQKAFYESVLSLPIQESDNRFFAFQAGKTKVVFTKSDDERQSPYYLAFGIPETQLALVRERLTQSSALLRDRQQEVFPFRAQNAQAIYGLDPGGNVVAFVTAPGTTTSATDDSTVINVLKVAEIGLVVDDVGTTVSALQSRFGLRTYRTETNGKVVVGDEQGTLLVMKRGQSWFPSAQPAAEIGPVMMTIEGEENAVDCVPDLPYYIHTANQSLLRRSFAS